jgi:glycosyltransferase involved in cell wall biosynthesis
MMSASVTTRPRSIGIVLHDFPLGGTERIALRLARAWGEAGVAVTIFCGDRAGPLLAMAPPSDRIVPADPPIPRGIGSRNRLGAAAARHFAEQPVDALFVTGNYHWEVTPALAAMPADVRPAILVQISSPIQRAQRGRLRQRLFERRLRRLLAGADAVVAMDEPDRALATGILGRDIVTAIPLPALDDDAPPPKPIPPGGTVLAAGRLIHQKGFDLLIDAFARLPDPGTRLVIVGSGPEEARLRARIARRGLGDRVTLAGYAPDIRPWLDAARLFVLPSRFEGYGAVIVEALAAGRPVLATRSTPAVADLLGDPARGTVVPVADVAAMAAAMAEMLRAPPPDPDALTAAVGGYRLAAGAEAYLALFAHAMIERAA